MVPPETTLLSILASLEARAEKGIVSIKEMMEATGLTTNQVRYGGRKPEYKNYLEIAKRQLSEGSTEPFVQDARPTPAALRQKIANPGMTSSGPATSTYSSLPLDPSLAVTKIHSSCPSRSLQARATTPSLYAGPLTTIPEKPSPIHPTTLTQSPSTKKKLKVTTPSTTGPLERKRIMRYENYTRYPFQSFHQNKELTTTMPAPPPGILRSANSDPLDLSTTREKTQLPELPSECGDEAFLSYLAKMRPTVDACTL